MPFSVCSPVGVKADVGPHHHVAHGARHPDGAVVGGLLDAGSEIHGDPEMSPS